MCSNKVIDTALVVDQMANPSADIQGVVGNIAQAASNGTVLSHIILQTYFIISIYLFSLQYFSFDVLLCFFWDPEFRSVIIWVLHCMKVNVDEKTNVKACDGRKLVGCNPTMIWIVNFMRTLYILYNDQIETATLVYHYVYQ